MTPVFFIALPVFAIIAAGMAAGRFALLSATDAQVLNKFVFQFAMPAALFGLTATTPPPGLADAGFAGAYAVTAGIVLAVAYSLSKALFNLSGPEAGAHAFASVFGNAVFLGLPIALSVDGWARPFVILMLVEGTVVIALGAALMAPGGGKISEQLLRPLRNPLVVAAALGMGVSAIGATLPGPILAFFEILGRAAGPTALFSLGLFLATHQFPSMASVIGKIGLIAIGKLVAMPAIALLFAGIFGVSDPNALGALALFTFVPTAVGAFIMASQYGRYTSEIAAAVALTTIFSVATISAVLMRFA